MKRILTICIIAVCCITAGYAQKAKFGHVDYGAVMKDMANTTTSSAILKVKEDELMKLYTRLQDFVASSEMDLQNKQIELLKPFQDKLMDAIKKVAENGKYTYIFDITMCAFHTDAEDITAAVKKELGIK